MRWLQASATRFRTSRTAAPSSSIPDSAGAEKVRLVLQDLSGPAEQSIARLAIVAHLTLQDDSKLRSRPRPSANGFAGEGVRTGAVVTSRLFSSGRWSRDLMAAGRGGGPVLGSQRIVERRRANGEQSAPRAERNRVRVGCVRKPSRERAAAMQAVVGRTRQTCLKFRAAATVSAPWLHTPGR